MEEWELKVTRVNGLRSRLLAEMKASVQTETETGSVPGVKRPDPLLLADPEEGVEHPPVTHLRVLGLTLDLQPRLGQVDGKRP